MNTHATESIGKLSIRCLISSCLLLWGSRKPYCSPACPSLICLTSKLSVFIDPQSPSLTYFVAVQWLLKRYKISYPMEQRSAGQPWRALGEFLSGGHGVCLQMETDRRVNGGLFKKSGCFPQHRTFYKRFHKQPPAQSHTRWKNLHTACWRETTNTHSGSSTVQTVD